MDEHELQAALRLLPEEVHPDGDLWPRIAKQHRNRSMRRRLGRKVAIVAAASVILMIAFSQLPPPSPSTSKESLNPETPPTAPGSIPQREWEVVRDRIKALIFDEDSTLSPALAQELLLGLETLDRAFHELQSTLDGCPDDSRLRANGAALTRMLQERQAELLQSAHQLQ